ncbi:hypothetical protein FEE95_04775 [Maribacter algarum]|uniref:Lipocalin-like domain-containing protein n=1 Tax=Maribacter algarum (ex Zhang et al. 2020) TaxID=2578118 RepID=A0A5S3PUS0_9FLAO|nr:hypothetical protein [Maribacter algarum]TMM58749.1 hypothetical protein FEE95_04775 [Maribacter algarum]
MKTKAIISMVVCALMLTSCSKVVEKLIDEPEDVENILVEESPWTFSRYENTVIEDNDGSGLSGQEIENDINQYFIDISFTFNSDGTGFIDIPEQGREDWVWTLSNNRLTTISNTQTDEYTFFSADRNEMTFESRTSTLHTRDSIEYVVTHVGKYFFN